MFNLPKKNNGKSEALRIKGGMMFFAIERPERLYKGTILLAPAKNDLQRRTIYIKEYRMKHNLFTNAEKRPEGTEG